MATLKFGQDRERRPNPLVELHDGFEAANGDQVPAYLRIVKFKKDASGKNTATSINVSVAYAKTLAEDILAAVESAETIMSDSVVEAQ